MWKAQLSPFLLKGGNTRTEILLLASSMSRERGAGSHCCPWERGGSYLTVREKEMVVTLLSVRKRWWLPYCPWERGGGHLTVREKEMVVTLLSVRKRWWLPYCPWERGGGYFTVREKEMVVTLLSVRKRWWVTNILMPRREVRVRSRKEATMFSS